MTASDGGSNAAEVTSLSVRVTLLTILVFGALALLLIPVSKFPWPKMPGLIPLFVAGIFFAQLPTACLLILWFRRQCRWSLLLLGCTYFYSALMSLSHLLTFPGAILVDQPLVAVPEQSTAWIFTAWTNGFALLALIAVFLEGRFSQHHIARNRVQRAIATAFFAVLAAVVIVTLAVAKLELPALVTQNGFTTLELGCEMVVDNFAVLRYLPHFVCNERAERLVSVAQLGSHCNGVLHCSFHRRGGTVQCWLVYRTA